MIIDTHAHLDFPDYKSDLESVLSRAKEADVDGIINVGTSLASSKKSVALANRLHNIYASIGSHPHDASKVSEQDWQTLESLIHEKKVIAVGETGLDYYRNRSPHEDQQRIFHKHLTLAKNHNLPVIFHCRDASDDCLKRRRGVGFSWWPHSARGEALRVDGGQTDCRADGPPFHPASPVVCRRHEGGVAACP